MSDRKFEGVWIPAKLWLCTEIKLLHKVFLVEINSLDNEDGCWATNARFAKFFGLSKSRVSHVISELEELGFINIEFEYVHGTKEVAKRIIRMNHKAFNEKLASFEPIADMQGGIAKTQGGIADLAMRDIQPSNTIHIPTNVGEQSSLFEIGKDDIVSQKEENKESKRANATHTLLDAFCERRPRLQKLIWDYYKIRITKGLQPKQMQIILEDIDKYAKTDAKAMEYLRSAIAGGYMQVVPVWVTNPNYKPKGGKKFDPNAKPVSRADNTSNSEYSKKKPKRSKDWQDEIDVAVDEDGNPLKF